jgi:hypothetical protein
VCQPGTRASTRGEREDRRAAQVHQRGEERWRCERVEATDHCHALQHTLLFVGRSSITASMPGSSNP